MEIRYEKLNHGNFGGRSLDEFIRHQTISECWRKVDGELKLVPNEFAEDWTVENCLRNFLQAIGVIFSHEEGYFLFGMER